MRDGLQLSAVGIGTVVFVLVVLALSIRLIDQVQVPFLSSGGSSETPRQTAPPAPAPAAPASEPDTDEDARTAAAIAVALALAERDSRPSQPVVTALRPAAATTSGNWAASGRARQMSNLIPRPTPRRSR